MSPIFTKSSKKLPNHATKAHMKFESYRMLFDGGSPPIKEFSLTRRGFVPFMLAFRYLLVVQCCVIAQNLCKGLIYIYESAIYL